MVLLQEIMAPMGACAFKLQRLLHLLCVSLIPSHLGGPLRGRGQPQHLDDYGDCCKQDHLYGRETLSCAASQLRFLSIS